MLKPLDMQGKLVKMSESNYSLFNEPPSAGTMEICKIGKIYGDYVYFNLPYVTVDIPNDLVEDVRDYRPLSIFTVGWQHDSTTCPKFMNAPKELPEVQRILADKGSTRPYYADAKEKIASIQHELQNQLSVGCSPTPGTTDSYPKNLRLDTVNILLAAPSYGINEAAKDLRGKK
jgi:hypothetical protein